jgi:acetylornithine deacetylase/succinyl-diaminopimelate desuccinylase-like protein
MAEYPLAYPLSIGRVRCGEWASTVPDLLVAEGLGAGPGRVLAERDAQPTLHYGPGDVRLAHGPHEAVDVDELVAITESLALALVRACS